MRRKPAHCSKVRGPSRATFSRSLRLANGPLASRCATMASASEAPRPDTRASSGAEAVLRSTPTAFTASSTTASSERPSRYWSTSCWYWPTPIDFGSILTSSASGSCRRRAIETAPRSDTSRSGKLRRRRLRGRIDRGAGLADDHLERLRASPACRPACRRPAFPSRGCRCRCRWRSARPCAGGSAPASSACVPRTSFLGGNG